MTGSSILGWEWVEKNISAYWDGVTRSDPPGGAPNHSAGLGIFAAHCAETTDEARREAERACHAFVELNLGPGGLYEKLGPASPDYEYLNQVEEMKRRRNDLDYVIEAAPYIGYGTPDWWIARIERLRDLGYTEVLLRIDGMGHDVNMKAIRNFGRCVIPAFA
jgi:alkanesulfonate monooxygenase SsuD/methylene tetrahydromethanopterin reductase-like flavin-dependent oxidoreductase (luciferase family)